MNRNVSAQFENRVMDLLHDFPQTPSDLADRLGHHVDCITRCLRQLAQRGLVEQSGRVKRTGLWTLTRTRRAAA